ncbi:hypothetical protein LJC60_01840 [Ruminococcaceae bacterium OttesenSCG-928-D13]|nr:hypothetical protein [Ruminococcaceae bacterium OttesenSCG-928-D13]
MESFNARNAILAVVAAGHGSGVMEAARQFSAKRGSAVRMKLADSADTMAALGVSVKTEDGKEMVLIVAPDEVTADLLAELNRQCGLQTEARGVLFTMAIKSVSGLD